MVQIGSTETVKMAKISVRDRIPSDGDGVYR